MTDVRTERHDPGAHLGAVAIGIVVLLALESAFGLALQSAPPVGGQIQVGRTPAGYVTVDFTAPASAGRLDLHATVVATDPSRTDGVDHVYLMVDPNYPGLYVSTGDLSFVGGHLVQSLAQMGHPIPVSVVTGSGVASAIANDPAGALIIAGNPAPDSVLSPNSSELEGWLRNGGTLFWAGGPLGYASGYVGSDGRFRYDSSFWQGQIDLVGFPVTDPQPFAPDNSRTLRSVPPLFGSYPSRLGKSLGISYPSTADGANVSRLLAHGGYSLGFESSNPSDPMGTRTSLAYIPAGRGGVFFFGGGDVSSYQGYFPYAKGWIADGSVDIAEDIALILGSGYVPTAGPAASTDVVSIPGSVTHVGLSVTNCSGPVLAYLRSYTSGDLFYYAGTIASSPGPAARPRDECPASLGVRGSCRVHDRS